MRKESNLVNVGSNIWERWAPPFILHPGSTCSSLGPSTGSAGRRERLLALGKEGGESEGPGCPPAGAGKAALPRSELVVSRAPDRVPVTWVSEEPHLWPAARSPPVRPPRASRPVWPARAEAGEGREGGERCSRL